MKSPGATRRATLAIGAFAVLSPTIPGIAATAASIEKELIDMQFRYQQAFVDRDETMLRSYRADDWTIVFPDGRQVSRDEVERSFQQYRRELADIREVQVRFLAPEVALIHGLVRERFSFAGHLNDGLFRFTDVMVQSNGWRCVRSHFTLAENLLSEVP